MKKIVIIGAGQLGSRHLQSLNLLSQELEIHVIDPSLESLVTAESRFKASIQNVKHKISYDQKITPDQSIDIAIIASTANSRRSIVENLLNNSEVKHLVLEKLLFTQEQDYYDIAKLLSSKSTKAWVNCTMRMMPYYKHLNTVFQNETIQYHVNGSQYGLVTNAIHYLDHVAYLTGTDQFELDTRYLDNEIIPSKRKGYFELTGTLIARFNNGSIAFLHCSKTGISPIQIDIYNNKLRIISREWEQKAWQTSSEKDWQWEEVQAPISFQSSLTAELVTSLMETDNCNLTNYSTSMVHHLQLLNPLKQFLLAKKQHSDMEYPFT